MNGETSPPSAAPAKPTILVVEDEQPIQFLVRAVLEMHGYRVLTAGDADAALKLSAQHAGPIELIITDLRLPGITGADLVAQLLPARPDLRVLYISGNLAGETAALGTAKFLHKPFTPRELQDMVRDMLAV